MISKNKIYNYNRVLSQKYNAVCLDIDGTLTEPNSNVISDRAALLISDLLTKKIPVVLITGRGEVGLKNLIKDLTPKLNISKSLKTRMYVLTNDGARLFYTDIEKNNDILNSNKYITSDESFMNLSDFNNKFIDKIMSSSIKDFCNITYSKDAKLSKILNIRLVLNIKDEKMVLEINNIISEIIKEGNYNNLNVTTGIFEDKNVIQIGTCEKGKAIEVIEEIIGIPKNSMLRIGDCGDKSGNDYSMLNCEQGFSVNRYSDEENACFPVMDSKNNLIKGVEGTVYLINRVNLLPTLCLESANRQLYTKEYSKVEYQINIGKNEYIRKYSEMINKKFNMLNGIYDLYDKDSGSVMVSMYEWEMIDNNHLKNLFSNNVDGKLEYSLRDNNNYLLRGSKNYYYFLANRESINNNDFTSIDNVFEWYKNNIKFFQKALIAVCNTKETNIYNDKFILGILDNIRNFMIIILNALIMEKYKSCNVLLNLEKTENYEFNYIYKILIKNVGYMVDFSFNKINDYSAITEHLNSVIDYGIRRLDVLKNYAEIENYSKVYRAYREIDNFIENYITVKIHEDKTNDKDECVCGMLYGGIELPIIYKYIKKDLKDICVLKLNSDVSGYKKKQMIDIRLFNINNYGGLIIDGEFNQNNMVLMDDNLMTGKTMQIALNCMCDCNINVTNINIVRYPGINRVSQMFLNGHGAVDYRLFFEYITGLCFQCPYSWRDENSNDIYKDSLGVFDLNKKKIIECLIKNHDYSTISEVHEFYKIKRREKDEDN